MGYEQISSTTPIARKQHSCIWCREKIQPGEKHVHEIGKYYGDFQNHRWHPECLKACQDYFKDLGETEWEFSPNEYKRGTSEPCQSPKTGK